MFLASPITFPNLGITVDPSPVAFTVFGKDIYWYGIIIASGFLLAVLYMLHRAKDFGVTQDDVLDMILWAVPIGVVCARLYYCIFYWELYEDDPISMLYIWEGGLAIYGGIIGGVITLLVVAKVKKIPAPVLLDLAGMGVIIGQCIGRWGNFMNREAHGAVTEAFLKMGLQDAAGVVTYYHPTFLYESVWNLIGFIGLHLFSKKRKFDGEVFLLYVAWYGLGRAWIEGLRTDSLYLFNWTIAGQPIRVSQVLSLVLMIAALAVLFYNIKLHPHRPEDLYVNQVAAREAAAAAAAEAPAETEAAGSRDDAPESAQAEPLDDEPAAPKDESGGE